MIQVVPWDFEYLIVFTLCPNHECSKRRSG